MSNDIIRLEKIQKRYGEIEALKGVSFSIPENSIEFYKPLIEWISNYSENPKENTLVNIQLEYFNTSSSKCILDVFKKLESISDSSVSVKWYYEEDDEDMLEAGEDYEAIIDLSFEMIEVEEL